MKNIKKPLKTGSLTVKDWLDLAEIELAKNGISAVRVEVLAKKLKVTKGSFYWHFSDRNELFNKLLARWRIRSTNAIINRLNDANLTPVERLKSIFLLPHNKTGRINGGALEAAIRNWSQNDENVRKTLDEVDSSRLIYISDIFKTLGNDSEVALVKAARFYYVLQGMAIMDSNKSDSHLEEVFNMLL